MLMVPTNHNDRSSYCLSNTGSENGICTLLSISLVSFVYTDELHDQNVLNDPSMREKRPNGHRKIVAVVFNLIVIIRWFYFCHLYTVKFLIYGHAISARVGGCKSLRDVK